MKELEKFEFSAIPQDTKILVVQAKDKTVSLSFKEVERIGKLVKEQYPQVRGPVILAENYNIFAVGDAAMRDFGYFNMDSPLFTVFRSTSDKKEELIGVTTTEDGSRKIAERHAGTELEMLPLDNFPIGMDALYILVEDASIYPVSSSYYFIRETQLSHL